MTILDTFCGEGGASKGYSDAGFKVVGVDIEEQPRYPYKFNKVGAFGLLKAMRERKAEVHATFTAIHASPPCQFASKAHPIRKNYHLNAIDAIRELLLDIGLPYIIENVEGARAYLRDPVMLCGTMFDKPYYRHRLFECSFPVSTPEHRLHLVEQTKMGRYPKPTQYIQAVGNFVGVERTRREFEMPWASQAGLSQCIPPVYTEYIGSALNEYRTRMG